MFKKVVSLVLLSAMSLGLLSGCASDMGELDALNGLSALNSESHVTSSYNLSYTDAQEMIYAQVSNRNLIDMSELTSCSDDEINQVLNYMDGVDRQLIGQVRVNSFADQSSKWAYDGYLTDDSVIDTGMTNYLLTVMQQTPWYWQRTKTTIRGMDSESRSIVVDVTYKTIDFEKEVVADSTIILGEPDYDQLSQSRYSKWLRILATRINNPNDPNLYAMEQSFLEIWGDPEEIIAEQRRYDPTGQIYMTGNQQTYSGLIDSVGERSTGTMVVRYVLVPRYVLGINLGMECQHMYLVSYNLDSDVTAGLETFTKEGYQTVTDSVYNLIYSYFTCIDESDFNGMYKLTSDFEGLDKHWQDVFNSTFQKHDGFSVSLFDIVGTHITCGVTISTKERARGANISMPIYTDRYYMELELVDETLKVNNMIWLSRKLEGEPAIAEGEVDTTGFSAIIDLSNGDKLEIEKLICSFSALQLAGDTTSDSFLDVVDGSITTNQLSSLKTNMMSLTGARKVVFLQNYQQGTSNYASVRCKELYQDNSNAIVEATSTYEFIVKGGRWYVYNYDVNSSMRLDTTNLTTAGSLCLVEPNNIVSYTSQLRGTVGTNIDEVSDISISYDHAAYTPVLKNGNQEQGLVLITSTTITDEIFERLAPAMNLTSKTMPEFYELLAEIDRTLTNNGIDPIGDDVRDVVLNAMAVYYNKSGGRYSDMLAQEDAVSEAAARLNDLNEYATDLAGSIEDIDEMRQFQRTMAQFNEISRVLRGSL